MPRHCRGCSHPTICRTHGCAAEEYRKNKERNSDQDGMVTDPRTKEQVAQVLTENGYLPVELL